LLRTPAATGISPLLFLSGCLACLAVGARPAAGGLVINEFLPDPQGADSGQEFVEILNTGPTSENLLSVSIQFANGTEGAVWSSRWTCLEEILLPAGQRFLVVDRNWLGEVPGQAEVWLGLQNGPDAIRLTRAETVLDMVGYGPLTDPQMVESNPVPVTPGLSLARRPDGRDTDDNSLDFVSHAPSPGQPNFLPFALQLTGLEVDPASADRPDCRVVITASVTNTGTESLPTGPLILAAFGVEVQALMDECPPEETRQLTWLVTARARGRWPLLLKRLVTAEPETLVVDLGQFQVGPAELVLNEVMGAPGAGQGEWIELLCPGTEAVNLGSYLIRDEDGQWLPLPEEILQPGELAVLAQDAAALVSWGNANLQEGLADCSDGGFLPPVLEMPGAWPNLNNSPPGDRDFSDRVYLCGGDGTVLDQVTLGSEGPNVSLERIAWAPVNPIASNWAPCTSLAGGTPGCPNSLSRPDEAVAALTINPPVLDPGQGVSALHFRFPVELPAEGWCLRVFNTWGEAVRDLGCEMLGPGPRDLIWDGRDDQGQPVPGGPYVVLLQLRGPLGETVSSAKAVTGVRR
jgi:hypothetical protein